MAIEKPAYSLAQGAGTEGGLARVCLGALSPFVLCSQTPPRPQRTAYRILSLGVLDNCFLRRRLSVMSVYIFLDQSVTQATLVLSVFVDFFLGGCVCVSMSGVEEQRAMPLGLLVGLL